MLVEGGGEEVIQNHAVFLIQNLSIKYNSVSNESFPSGLFVCLFFRGGGRGVLSAIVNSPIHFCACDQIICSGKPVERTIKSVLKSFHRSAPLVSPSN